jgi:hypothetical protein
VLATCAPGDCARATLGDVASLGSPTQPLRTLSTGEVLLLLSELDSCVNVRAAGRGVSAVRSKWSDGCRFSVLGGVTGATLGVMGLSSDRTPELNACTLVGPLPPFPDATLSVKRSARWIISCARKPTAFSDRHAIIVEDKCCCCAGLGRSPARASSLTMQLVQVWKELAPLWKLSATPKESCRAWAWAVGTGTGKGREWAPD